jgi:UDP-N-acetylenolpyruvoylglucosamine reductase
LINTKNASSKDLIALGEEAKKEVFKAFNIDLEWEIKILK